MWLWGVRNLLPYLWIKYMRYSGSRFVREIRARLSENEVRYHGPGKEERGWKNCMCMMRYRIAVRARMGTSRLICRTDSVEKSMLLQ